MERVRSWRYNNSPSDEFDWFAFWQLPAISLAIGPQCRDGCKSAKRFVLDRVGAHVSIIPEM